MRWIALIAFVLATTPTWSQTLTLEGNVSAQTTGATAVLRADRIRFSCPTGVTACVVPPRRSWPTEAQTGNLSISRPSSSSARCASGLARSMRRNRMGICG